MMELQLLHETYNKDALKALSVIRFVDFIFQLNTFQFHNFHCLALPEFKVMANFDLPDGN